MYRGTTSIFEEIHLSYCAKSYFIHMKIDFPYEYRALNVIIQNVKDRDYFRFALMFTSINKARVEKKS